MKNVTGDTKQNEKCGMQNEDGSGRGWQMANGRWQQMDWWEWGDVVPAGTGLFSAFPLFRPIRNQRSKLFFLLDLST